FPNFVLAVELMRALVGVGSVLLEAMQERQVTLAGETRKLPDPFLVLATQNPVEQEGTYALPEAQVDRFMVKLVVGYPSKAEELRIIDRMAALGAQTEVQPATTPEELLRMRQLLDTIYLDDKVKSYIVDLVFATREPAAVGLDKLGPMILYGASPRASLALARASRARAFLEGRGFVTPQDVKAVGAMVLRHRVLTTYEAEAEGITSEQVLQSVFDSVRVP
ncbi:MAG: MoxR family ATPase, partial [Planctomycetes bacterium]|nr:MoxR family ATPase [Planctomycetota bacterium]